MTTEEKAKAYDEALNWMRKLYPGLHGATKEDAEHYFPELRESEDERIRMWLVAQMQKFHDEANKEGCWEDFDMTEKAIFYLEKQKEQNPAEWSEEDERMRNQLIYDIEHHKKEGLISAKQNKATKALYDGIEKCYDEKIAWLKSIRPQPHWKPSEEQMRALNEIICLGEISYVGQEEELIALRNKLKRLM